MPIRELVIVASLFFGVHIFGIAYDYVATSIENPNVAPAVILDRISRTH